VQLERAAGTRGARLDGMNAAPERKREDGTEPRPDALAALHGGYYVLTGLWPVFHLRSFEAVTGPKPEGWLVKGTGLLIASIGTALLTASRTRERATSSVLALTAALSLGGVSFRYAAQRRISPVYFLDAALHLGLVTAWAIRVLEHRYERPLQR
jgi:hypothetical protein